MGYITETYCCRKFYDGEEKRKNKNIKTNAEVSRLIGDDVWSRCVTLLAKTPATKIISTQGD